VEPAKVIEAVRLEAVRQQGKNHLTPDQIPAMLDEDMPGQLLMTALRKYSK
jgi:heterodisulfide reductase subunit C